MSDDRVTVTISISSEVAQELQQASKELYEPSIENEIVEILDGWMAERKERQVSHE